MQYMGIAVIIPIFMRQRTAYRARASHWIIREWTLHRVEVYEYFLLFGSLEQTFHVPPRSLIETRSDLTVFVRVEKNVRERAK